MCFCFHVFIHFGCLWLLPSSLAVQRYNFQAAELFESLGDRRLRASGWPRVWNLDLTTWRIHQTQLCLLDYVSSKMLENLLKWQEDPQKRQLWFGLSNHFYVPLLKKQWEARVLMVWKMADFHRQGRRSFTLPKTNLDFGDEETTFILVWIIFITHWCETTILKRTFEKYAKNQKWFITQESYFPLITSKVVYIHLLQPDDAS